MSQYLNVSLSASIVPSMANVQESFSRAPSFQKTLTETMVWPGSASQRQAELVRFVNLYVNKFGCRNIRYWCSRLLNQS